MVGSLEGRLWDRSSGERSVAEDEDCLQGRAGRSVRGTEAARGAPRTVQPGGFSHLGPQLPSWDLGH